MNRENQSFEKIYSEYNKRFIRFAATYVGDVMIAEDIVMDSFIYYWERRDTLASDVNIPAYILTTIKNKCINNLKRLRLREDIVNKMRSLEEWELNLRISTLEACNPELIFSDEMRTIVKNVINQLPQQTRVIFCKSRYGNSSNKEIALDMGISVKTVEFHITKSLKLLRLGLKDYMAFLLL